MNFVKSAAFCLGITAAFWASPQACLAETLNMLTALQAGGSATLSTGLGWDASFEDFLSKQTTIYDFVGDPEVRINTFEGNWLSILSSDWDKLDRLFLAKEVAGWTSEPVPELANSDAVPSRAPEPELWVLALCGLGSVIASATLRRRFQIGK
jgi:hypothetical protein